MELIVRIVSQGELVENEYVKDGQSQKFASMPFVLQHGFDKIACEMIQNSAREQGRLADQFFYVANISISVNEYKDKNGRSRMENRITLNKLTLL